MNYDEILKDYFEIINNKFAKKLISSDKFTRMIDTLVLWGIKYKEESADE